MVTNSSEEALLEEWERNEEPMKEEKDPKVILDTALGGTAWLFDSMNEETAWLVFDGETREIKQ